jgi:Fe-S cluster biogenesis protein NfuA
MFIQIEETPNPNTLKFLPGIEIMPQGQTASFRSEEDCKNSKLAKLLLEVDGVESVFFGSDFMSITKAESVNWQSLKAIIVATIVDYVTGVEVIDEKVRPAVAQDGGDIVFHSYKDGVVYVEMQGACSGCPSATLTLKDGIENMLQYYIPEVIRVEQI